MQIYQYKQFATGNSKSKKQTCTVSDFFRDSILFYQQLDETTSHRCLFSQNLTSLSLLIKIKITQLETLKKKLLQDMFIEVPNENF